MQYYVRSLLAKERVAECETMDSDADETGVYSAWMIFFFRWMRDTMESLLEGPRGLSKSLISS